MLILRLTPRGTARPPGAAPPLRVAHAGWLDARAAGPEGERAARWGSVPGRRQRRGVGSGDGRNRQRRICRSALKPPFKRLPGTGYRSLCVIVKSYDVHNLLESIGYAQQLPVRSGREHAGMRALRPILANESKGQLFFKDGSPLQARCRTRPWRSRRQSRAVRGTAPGAHQPTFGDRHWIK